MKPGLEYVTSERGLVIIECLLNGRRPMVQTVVCGDDDGSDGPSMVRWTGPYIKI